MEKKAGGALVLELAPGRAQAPPSIGFWPEVVPITIDDLADDLNRAVDFPGLTNAWTMPIKTRIDMLATGIKTPVGIKLMGSDLDGAQSASGRRSRRW